MKDQWRDKIVVITGASSGIGFSIAKIFVVGYAKLFLIARDSYKLNEAKKMLHFQVGNGAFIKTYSIDIGLKDKVNSVINEIGDEYGKIDVLVNNAGVMRCGRFDELPIDDFELSLRTNYVGALLTTKAAWKYLQAAKGNVSFVCSVAGYMGLIGYSTYSPTKYAMAGLAECLRMEGKRVGIKVSIIYPGDTDTPMLHFEKKHSLPETRELTKGIKTRDPHEVARILVNGILNNKFEIYVDSQSRLYRIFKVVFQRFFFMSIDSIAQHGIKGIAVGTIFTETIFSSQ